MAFDVRAVGNFPCKPVNADSVLGKPQGAVFLILTARPGTWYNAYSISYQCGCSLLLDSGKTLLYEKQFEMQRKECSPMMITAHSGSDGTPDNSLEFVHYVLSLRPDAFEIDVHRRSDGVLVIAHDADPSGAYADCPTLAGVCRLAASLPQIGINYDCKEAGLELDVCALHSECCPGNPIFLSGTVSPALYRDRRADFRGAVPLLNAEEMVRDFYPRMLAGESAACGKEAAEACKSCGASVVNVYCWCCPDPFLKELRDAGLNASVWTVDEPDLAELFRVRDVFNLTTRIPAELIRTFDR